MFLFSSLFINFSSFTCLVTVLYCAVQEDVFSLIELFQLFYFNSSLTFHTLALISHFKSAYVNVETNIHMENKMCPLETIRH